MQILEQRMQRKVCFYSAESQNNGQRPNLFAIIQREVAALPKQMRNNCKYVVYSKKNV
jgi:hypothetical protein